MKIGTKVCAGGFSGVFCGYDLVAGKKVALVMTANGATVAVPASQVKR